jgi:hypothetical protein
MNAALIEQVVHAVLYEGYILYPYRASTKKNRQRFTFGRVYPEAYSVAQGGAEPCAMQTECLLKRGGVAADAAVEISVRFLHPMAREVGELVTPLPELPAALDPAAYRLVPELRVDGQLHPAWHEAVERQVLVPVQNLAALVEQGRSGGASVLTFDFPASRTLEPIRGNASPQVVGVIVRRQEALAGAIEFRADAVDADVSRITVRILNRTPLPASALHEEEPVLLRLFASTHTVLRAHGESEFISLLEPPAEYAAAAAACKNIGVWPVLVGEEEKGERDVMLASPIILYDYPKIAPESAGDLCDSGEIDEILSLRIMTLTDEEKHEMRQVDDYARRILERTDALPQESLRAMHGAMRETVTSKAPEPAPAASSLESEVEDFFNPDVRLQSVTVAGVDLRAGDRVRIRPRGRADIIDLALAGRIAVIEAVEQDAEDRVHLALVLEDDPGRDLGMLRQPGHRFFYATDEVEPMPPEGGNP